MQLNLFDDLYALEQKGYTVKKTFESSNDDKFKRLESTWSVTLNGNIIQYVQDNDDGTYNAFGYMRDSFNVDLQEVIEILKNKNNWCLYTSKNGG